MNAGLGILGSLLGFEAEIPRIWTSEETGQAPKVNHTTKISQMQNTKIWPSNEIPLDPKMDQNIEEIGRDVFLLDFSRTFETLNRFFN